MPEAESEFARKYYPLLAVNTWRRGGGKPWWFKLMGIRRTKRWRLSVTRQLFADRGRKKMIELFFVGRENSCFLANSWEEFCSSGIRISRHVGMTNFFKLLEIRKTLIEFLNRNFISFDAAI